MEYILDWQRMWGINFLGALIFSLAGFTLSRFWRRNDIADVLWGTGFIVIALIQASMSGPLSFKGKLALALLALWGLRLALYIGSRMISKGKEDVRYANWRREWGSKEPIMALFKIFILQGLIMALVVLPVSMMVRLPELPLTATDFYGTLIFLLGLLLESASDLQMARFQKDPSNKGKIMKEGLWAHSRHPNYFGEMLVWWGFFLMVLPSPGGGWAILSPLLMTFLLSKVSGVPMLDKVLAQRGEDFKNYARATRSLLPFGWRDLLVFIVILVVILGLDGLWLGWIMKDFYLSQSQQVGRIVNGQWDVVPWAAITVYLFLAGGLQFFAVAKANDPRDALMRGATFGLAVYAVYEFTNVALVQNWPLQMALVDVLWGTLLGAVAAFLGSSFSLRNR